MSAWLATRNSVLSTFNAVNINYSTLSGSTLNSSTINASTIFDSTITSRTVNFSTLQGSTITTQSVSYSTLTGSSIVSNVVTGSVIGGNAMTMSTISTATLSVNSSTSIYNAGTLTVVNTNAIPAVSAAIIAPNMSLVGASGNLFVLGQATTQYNSMVMGWFSVGAGSTSNYLNINGYSSSTGGLNITAGGNVGIGITNPSASLHVNTNDILVTSGGNSGGAGGAIKFGIASYPNATPMSWIQGSLENMYIGAVPNQAQGGIGFFVTPVNVSATTTSFRAMHITSSGTIVLVGNNTLGSAAGSLAHVAQFGGGGSPDFGRLNLYGYRISTGSTWETSAFMLRYEVDGTNFAYTLITRGGLSIGNPNGVSTADISADGTNGVLNVRNNGTGGAIVRFAGNSTLTGAWDIRMDAVGPLKFILYSTFPTSTTIFQLNENGSAWLAGALTQNSDIILKKNIEPVANGLSIISTINPVLYHFKTQSDSEYKHYGMIAQDVQKVLPNLVGESNEILTLNYIEFVPILISAVKEQNAIIKSQQAQIDSQKAQIDSLLAWAKTQGFQ